MARTFWPNEDAIGKRWRLYYDKDPQRWITVVGIARDAYYRYDEAGGFTRRRQSQLFLSQRQNPLNAMPRGAPFVSLVVRTAGDPVAIAGSLRAAIWAIDRNQPITNVEPMEAILWQSVSASRIYTLLLGIFAAIALVIASAGLYGVSAYAVVRRTRVIGIRLAVGATTGQILGLMLRHGLTLTTLGVVIGIAGAFALTNVMAAFLFGISATDAPTVVSVVVLFTVIAFVSTYIPARRAAKTDPTVAFRFD
jgi:putative ABC transport system permease protein